MKQKAPGFGRLFIYAGSGTLVRSARPSSGRRPFGAAHAPVITRVVGVPIAGAGKLSLSRRKADVLGGSVQRALEIAGELADHGRAGDRPLQSDQGVLHA